MKAPRSAIVVPIRLPSALEGIRVRETAGARRGVPAHVTILFPFVAPGSIDRGVLAKVSEIVRAVRAFDVAFREVRRWEPGGGAPEGVVWLAPEPAAPFNELTAALFAAFPDHPPYGGMHDDPIPHVTLASNDRRRMDAVEAAAASHVPFRRLVGAAALIVEGADGRWRTRRRFPLGG